MTQPPNVGSSWHEREPQHARRVRQGARGQGMHAPGIRTRARAAVREAADGTRANLKPAEDRNDGEREQVGIEFGVEHPLVRLDRLCDAADLGHPP